MRSTTYLNDAMDNKKQSRIFSNCLFTETGVTSHTHTYTTAVTKVTASHIYTFSGVRVTHTHTKTFPSETAAPPIRPGVCSNSKLAHRDQSQFISVKLLVTETEAFTEVELTNLPAGKYKPAHIVYSYTGELRRRYFYCTL